MHLIKSIFVIPLVMATLFFGMDNSFLSSEPTLDGDYSYSPQLFAYDEKQSYSKSDEAFVEEVLESGILDDSKSRDLISSLALLPRPASLIIAERLNYVSDSQSGMPAVEPNVISGGLQDVSPSEHYKVSAMPYLKRKNICSICLKAFPKPSSLERHIRSHTGERPYACSQCSYMSAEKGNLVRHEKTHRNFREFFCRFKLPGGYFCDRSFMRKEHAKNHLWSQHEITRSLSQAYIERRKQ